VSDGRYAEPVSGDDSTLEFSESTNTVFWLDGRSTERSREVTEAAGDCLVEGWCLTMDVLKRCDQLFRIFGSRPATAELRETLFDSHRG
jgi:hypothetical protein